MPSRTAGGLYSRALSALGCPMANGGLFCAQDNVVSIALSATRRYISCRWLGQGAALDDVTDVTSPTCIIDNCHL